MTTDTQNRDPASIEVLDEAKLEAVNGGSVGDGVARAVLGFRLGLAAFRYDVGEVYRASGPCGELGG